MRHDPLAYLRCPACRGRFAAEDDCLRCIACHARFPVDDGIPRLLAADRDGAATPALVAALDADMRRHRRVVAMMSIATCTWIPAERARLLGNLGIRPGESVLDHCTGPGANLPSLARAVGRDGMLVAMDLSGLVVRQARALVRRRGIAADIHQADARRLPYADDAFDTVVHYGALNQLADDRKTAIDEILRVTRPGGLVVLLDEGIAERRRDTWWGRALIARNPLFASRPPLDLLPRGIVPELRWVIRGMFWELRLRKPS